MTDPNRAVLGGLAFAATGFADSQTFAATKDSHAAGYDASAQPQAHASLSADGASAAREVADGAMWRRERYA